MQKKTQLLIERKMFPARIDVVLFSLLFRTRINTEGMIFTKNFSILYYIFNRDACPHKQGPSKPYRCEDCDVRFDSERARNNHQRLNVCGQKKKRKTCSICGDSVLSYNWKRHLSKCGHKCSKCDHISATDQARLISKMSF